LLGGETLLDRRHERRGARAKQRLKSHAVLNRLESQHLQARRIQDANLASAADHEQPRGHADDDFPRQAL
jgi:hypothetical protein